ncbi:hypothetical protein DASC09_022020 [Saccharomycopsis crataegensis]|uniref:chitinase n=1 Tax=Saccharomycopsis crataegensis TaxID=43959 RepID=A0AAV5QJU3_9ASCO|nr:hypothetical protein DASC09_022020 [Saccharomycopsis crataegensis]
MRSLFKTALLCTILFGYCYAKSFLLPVNASNETKWQNNLAVYWGQNSIELDHDDGKHVEYTRLIDICDDPNVDIVIISFVDEFLTVENSFQIHNDDVNHNNNIAINAISILRNGFSDDFDYSPQTFGEEIEECKLNEKIVLLSFGGDTGSYGFDSEEHAIEFADVLYQWFGNHSEVNMSKKPFRNAAINGIDLDIENSQYNNVYYIGFIKRIRENFGPEFLIAGAPQCLYPDENMDVLLTSEEIYFDILFIQFYNNGYDCNANTNNFNWNTWVDYAANHQPNKQLKLFMGLPASDGEIAAENGYIDDKALLKDKINFVEENGGDKWFGGISLWEASLGYNNYDFGGNYIEEVKKELLPTSGDVSLGKDNTGEQNESDDDIVHNPRDQTDDKLTSSSSLTKKNNNNNFLFIFLASFLIHESC